MGENHSDDPEFIYTAKKAIGRDGKFYPEINEFNGEVGGYKYLNTTGSLQVYQPTSVIAKLHLRSLLLASSGVSAMSVTIIDSDSAATMMFIQLASGATAIRTLALTGLKGPVFKYGFYAQASRKGGHLSFNAVQDPNMPSV